MKKLLSQLLWVPLALLAISPVSAQTNEIKQIQLEEDTPKPLTVYLAPGQGITIDYRRIGQTIETMWIDNKRYVGVSTDGNLLGSAGGSAADPASALHLNLIESPSNNSIEKSNRSLVTVVTVDPQKHRRYFLYSVYPNYTTSDGDSTKLIEYVMPVQSATKFDATRLAKNIKLMIGQGLIRDLKLIERTNKLISYLNEGMSLEQAAKEAQLSMRFVNGVLAQN
jgi:hypothetical protein